MKKLHILLITTLLSALNSADLKNAVFIKIEKNLSKNFALKIAKKAKHKKIGFVLNPKINCLNAGFNKSDIFAKGVMMGKNRADGSLEVSGVGDFKAYEFIRYIKGKRECIETTYSKMYDPTRYGNYSYMVYQ
jgi:hypothetical protein